MIQNTKIGMEKKNMQSGNNDSLEQLKKLMEMASMNYKEPELDESKLESPYKNSIPVQYKAISKELPKHSIILKDDSGKGKSALMLHWKWLAEQKKHRAYYTTENKLMDDLYINEYGNKIIDRNHMNKLKYSKILMIDEIFNSKNWVANFENTYFTIGTLIEELYEFKRQSELIVVMASNNPIEKFLQEKSIVRKFHELFLHD